MFNGISYDNVVNILIRPPRAKYSLAQLGPAVFETGSLICQRTDFTVVNPRGLKVQCSHYEPIAPMRKSKKLPVVIFCHGNGGSRLTGSYILKHLLPHQITVVLFDFAGSGLSQGDYVTLGQYEKDDIGAIISHLRKLDTITTVGLWGHSMGAVSSFLYAQKDPLVASMVLDSPFSNLTTLMHEVVQQSGLKINKMLTKAATKIVGKSCKSKANLDISSLNLEKLAPTTFIPAVFAHGKNDGFIYPAHSERLKKLYAGDSRRILFEGDHSSGRPQEFIDVCTIFFFQTMIHEDGTRPVIGVPVSPSLANFGTEETQTSNTNSTSETTSTTTPSSAPELNSPSTLSKASLPQSTETSKTDSNSDSSSNSPSTGNIKTSITEEEIQSDQLESALAVSLATHGTIHQALNAIGQDVEPMEPIFQPPPILHSSADGQFLTEEEQFAEAIRRSLLSK